MNQPRVLLQDSKRSGLVLNAKEGEESAEGALLPAQHRHADINWVSLPWLKQVVGLSMHTQ